MTSKRKKIIHTDNKIIEKSNRPNTICLTSSHKIIILRYLKAEKTLIERKYVKFVLLLRLFLIQ